MDENFDTEKKASPLIFLLLGIGCFLAAGGTLIFLLLQKPALVTEPLAAVPPHMSTEQSLNFSLTPLPGWSVADRDTILPKGFSDVKLAYKKEGTSCVLAYAETVSEVFRNQYQQTMPGERVMVGKSQIDTWWWGPRLVSADPSFDSRAPRTGEVRVGNGHIVPAAKETAVFVLYTTDESAVPPVCDSESTHILKTLVTSFGDVTVDSSSDGFVYTISDHVVGGSRLVYQEIGAIEKKQLTMFDEYVPFLTVHNDRLYYQHNGSILLYDMLADLFTPLPGVATSTSMVVNDFYIKNDRLWYLLGKEGCNRYKTTCPLALYEIPAKGGTPKLLTDTITLQSGSIIGFDSTRTILYVLSSFGDAGYYSYVVYAYNYADGTVQKVLEDEGSGGEPPGQHAVADAQLAAIKAAITPAVVGSYVRLQDGRLSSPQGSDVPTDEGEKNFTFAQ